MFTGCSDQQPQAATGEKHTIISDSAKIVSRFRSVLDSNLSDELSYKATAHFFLSGHPVEGDYFLFFRYLLKASDETFSEPFGNRTFEALKKSTDKQKQVIFYLDLLPLDEKNIILERVISVMDIDIIDEQYSEAKFKADFPFLSNRFGLKILDEIIKNGAAGEDEVAR